MEDKLNDYLDLEIRVFPRQEAGYPIEITLGREQQFPRGFLKADLLPWSATADPIADGQRLFEALFHDPPLREAWAEARGRNPQRRVRLWLDKEAPELHPLPWELLYAEGSLLSADARTPFSRYLPAAAPWGRAHPQKPLRVLAAISNPADLEELYNLAPLDSARERAVLEKAFLSLDEEAVLLDFLEPPVTPERLVEKLQSGYTILHYTGHGAYSPRRQQAALYLEDEEGNAQVTPDSTLVELLAQLPEPPRLIFLAACQSATRATANAFQGLGPRLIAAGAPAVVAMQDFVNLETARKLCLAFYRRLSAHGQVDAALNEARSLLVSGGQPDAAVPTLLMRLQSGRLWEVEAPPPAAPAPVAPLIPPPPPAELPPETSGFIGRAGELAQLEQQLNATRRIGITGMPGIGKTTLMAALARHTAPLDQIFWYVLRPEESLGTLLWKLAGFLYGHDQKELWNLLQQIQLNGGKLPPLRDLLDYTLQQLKGKSYTLCLDNLQRLNEAEFTALAEFIPRLAAEPVKFILASQIILPFLAPEELLILNGLTPEEMHQLLSAQNLSLASEIEAELHASTEGNPQLLTLSMHLLKRSASPIRLMERLARQEDIENYLLKEIDEGLKEEEREILVALAILLGYPGEREVIETVTERSRLKRPLITLCRQHLINEKEGEKEEEYLAHATVRSFYYDLPGRRERESLHRRAADYYRSEKDYLKTALHSYQAGDYLAAFETTRHHFTKIAAQGQLAAVQRLLERLDQQELEGEPGIQIKILRGDVCNMANALSTGQTVLLQAWELTEGQTPGPNYRQLRAQICRSLARISLKSSAAQAEIWVQRGLEELAGMESPELPFLLILAGLIQRQTGNYSAAVEKLHQGLQKLVPGKELEWWITACNELGIIARMQGDLETSQKFGAQALEISRQWGELWITVALQINQGINLRSAGNWEGAQREYTEGLALARRLGSVHRLALLNLNLAVLTTYQGDYQLAENYLQEGYKLALQNDLKINLAYNLAMQGELYLRRQEYEAARKALAEAESQIAVTQARSHLPTVYACQAQIELAQGQLPAAWEKLQAALELARTLKSSLQEGSILRGMGQAHLAGGNPEAAGEAFAQSLALLNKEDLYENACTQAAWGKALQKEEPARARELLTAARDTFLQLGAQVDLQIVEKALEKL